MPASPMILIPIPGGWSISLLNGVEIARFRGLAAKWRAQRRLLALAR